MTRPAVLVLFTGSYPYDVAGEQTFLAPEMPHLANEFDRIIIVPRVRGGSNASASVESGNGHGAAEIALRGTGKAEIEVDSTLADHISVESDRLKTFRASLNAALIAKEISARPLQLASPAALRRLIAFSVEATRVADWLSDFVRHHQLSSCDTVFYTYWLDAISCGIVLRPEVIGGIPVISRAHGYDLYEEVHRPHYLPGRRFLLERLRSVHTVSQQGRSYLVHRYPAAEDHVMVSRLGTCDPGFTTRASDDGVLRIVSCSALVRVKQVSMIAEAIARAAAARPLRQIEWRHFGAGPEHADVERAMHAFKPDNLRSQLMGYVPNADVMQFYRRHAIDLFVNASSSEGIPVSIMEAQSCGIPCLAPVIGGVPEIVTSRNGYLVDAPASPAAIADRIVGILDTPEELAPRREASRAHWAQHFDADRNMAAFASRLRGIAYASEAARGSRVARRASVTSDASYRICTRCVMDTTDPEITFDADGVCNHCHRYAERIALIGQNATQEALTTLVSRIRTEGEGKQYDCIIGVSGGVDSTYVAYLTRSLNLRALAVHLDNGWDSELAVTNIALALRNLKIDLYTHVIDWDEFRDLQVSFLKASVPDAEIPTDHAIVSVMYSLARRFGTRYVLTGYNLRTESHMTNAWSQGYYDWRYIRAIHRRFGGGRLTTFPHMNLWRYWRNLRTIHFVDVLDYVDYVKANAIETLNQELGWRYYGGKHFESIYTRFYQGYFLRRKFGFDKRRSHLSSLICAGEISRDHALEELRKEPYPLEQQLEDRAYVIKKLRLSEAEFEEIMQLAKKDYTDYPSYGRLYRNPLFQSARRVRRFAMGD